jgi:flagellar basal-body rod modification protein FlgD
MSISLNAASNSSSSAQTGTTPAMPPAVSDLANEQTFLKLLVSQIQNQDPLNPTDSMQYVSQLAQFSELEQTIQIRTDVDALKQFVTNANGSGNGSSDSSTTPVS